MFVKDSCQQESNFLAVIGRWLPTDTKCGFVNVYAPNSPSAKDQLWDKLLSLFRINHGICWVVCGDFNEVRTPEERRGSVFVSRGATSFNNFIATTDLVEPPMGGKRFTWYNSSGNKCSKLDGFLFSPNFADKWPNSKALVLPRIYSDHCPILLDSKSVDFGPTPFKFYNSWLTSESLSKVVKEGWDAPSTGYNPRSRIHLLCKKPQLLKYR